MAKAARVLSLIIRTHTICVQLPVLSNANNSGILAFIEGCGAGGFTGGTNFSGHSETLRQRADMRQSQLSFYRGFYPRVFASKVAAVTDIFMNNVHVLRGIG